MDRQLTLGELGLVMAFLASGSLHLVRPDPFERIVPPGLPAKRALVYASGLAELGCAAGLLVPSTRRLAGLASAALLVAVFPANVQMTVDVGSSRGPLAWRLVLARLPLQIPMVCVAWRAWRPKDPTVK